MSNLFKVVNKYNPAAKFDTFEDAVRVSLMLKEAGTPHHATWGIDKTNNAICHYIFFLKAGQTEFRTI